MLLDQRVTDARCNGVSVCTHLIAAMGMGEHVGMVSKAYLLPLGDIIVRPIFLDLGSIPCNE